jgi:hypothetical protein
MVLAHARALLTSSTEGRTAYIQADLRDPGSILASPVLREVLDLGQPVALMFIAVLHFIPDEDEPGKVIATLLDVAATSPPPTPSRSTTGSGGRAWKRPTGAAVSGASCGIPASSPGWRSPAFSWCRRG